MKTEHPITPPPELVEQWIAQIWHEGTPVKVAANDLHVATQAARWGSDQELQACIQYFHKYDPSWGEDSELIAGLRINRRPKPPSLKEQALQALNRFMATEGHEGCTDEEVEEDYYLIRQAVESLPD